MRKSHAGCGAQFSHEKDVQVRSLMIKKWIGQEQFYCFSRFLGQLMIPDPRNRGDEYPCRSLDFDSLDNRAFEEKEAGMELPRRDHCFMKKDCFFPAFPILLHYSARNRAAQGSRRAFRGREADDKQ